jgi:Protein of unknown function (DUF3102)
MLIPFSARHERLAMSVKLAVANDAVAGSNSLPMLAAIIRAEHKATSDSLKQSVKHAMACGDALIEAKAQVPHGQWLPWLADNCDLSERSAQLYMRIAKNRDAIEAKYASGVADLNLNQAAALLFLSSEAKQLFAFIAELKNTASSEEIVQLCLDHGVGIIHDDRYDPEAGKSDAEVREWHLFILYLVRKCGWHPEPASAHVEWVVQRPFQNVAEWLGPEGDKFRSNPFNYSVTVDAIGKAGWPLFVAEHAAMTYDEIVAELERIEKARGKPNR